MAKCTEHDPLPLMNRFAKWTDPPKFDAKWAAALSAACEELAAANAEIERLRAEADKWKASYDDLASRIDKYPRTSDVERIGVLIKVIEQCRIELANLIMQTNATEGGSVWRAYQAAKEVLGKKGAPNA